MCVCVCVCALGLLALIRLVCKMNDVETYTWRRAHLEHSFFNRNMDSRSSEDQASQTPPAHSHRSVSSSRLLIASLASLLVVVH